LPLAAELIIYILYIIGGIFGYQVFIFENSKLIEFIHTNEFSRIDDLKTEARKYVEELRHENPEFEYSIRYSDKNMKTNGKGWWGCGN